MKQFNSLLLTTSLLKSSQRKDILLLCHWAIDIYGQTVDRNGDDAQKILTSLKKEIVRQSSNPTPSRKDSSSNLNYLLEKYKIPHTYPLEFITGLEMALRTSRFASFEDLIDYCHQVAGGLSSMIALILEPANHIALSHSRKLGVAIYLTIISKNILSDYKKGRIFLPETLLKKYKLDVSHLFMLENYSKLAAIVCEIQNLSETYYRSGKDCFTYFDKRSSWAIITLRNYYLEVEHQMHKRGSCAWNRQKLISLDEQILLTAVGAFQVAKLFLNKKFVKWETISTPQFDVYTEKL